MAINFKEINDRLELSPLNDTELTEVHKREIYFDEMITSRYNGNDMRFSLYIANFKHTTNGQQTNFAEARRKLMYEDLRNRFIKAGWECIEEIANPSDRYGEDYFVLRGKK